MKLILTNIFLALLFFIGCSGTPIKKNITNYGTPAHYEGPFVIDGPFDFDKEKIKELYDDLTPNRFGTLSLSFQGKPLKSRVTGKTLRIRELHYDLGGGRYGMRLFPIVDRDGGIDYDATLYPGNEELEISKLTFEKEYLQYPIKGKTANNFDVSGSEALDNYLKKIFGFDENDKDPPIVAVITYGHPELHTASFNMIGDPKLLKTENSMTHMGIYLGKGITRNSPWDYHDMKWEVGKYPAQVATVTFADVHPRIFNQNLIIALRLLNELNGGLKMPVDYKFDNIHAINLKETLDHYRAWLQPSWIKKDLDNEKPYFEYLKKNELFSTYCAEYTTIAINVAVNLPQNEIGYVEVFGEAGGVELWDRAKKAWKSIDNGREIPNVPYFEPLWKRKNYYQNPTDGKEIGKSLAWPSQTTADIIANFIEVYASWKLVGPVPSSMVLLAIMPIAVERLGISQQDYLQSAIPVIAKMITYDAMTRPAAVLDNYLASTYQAYESMDGALAKVMGVILPPLKKILNENRGFIIKNENTPVLKAWQMFHEDIRENIMKAGKMNAAKSFKELVYEQNKKGELDKKYVKFYNPPAVLHRIISNMHPHEPLLKFKTIGTVMDSEELIYTGKESTIYDVNE